MRIRSIAVAADRVVLAFGYLFLINSCTPPAKTEDTRSNVQAYLQRLRHWRYDSALIDSLSRLVPTDSLLALRRAELRAGTRTHVLSQAKLCETLRLSHRYGIRPTEAAIARLDSAFAPDERKRYERISLSGPSGMYRSDTVTCGPRGPQAPDSLFGVSLSQSLLRPWHPDSLPRR